MGVEVLSREATLLLLSAGGPITSEPMAHLCEEPIDWDLMLALAEREKASVILWRRLSAFEASTPEAARERLRRKAMVAEFRQLHLEQRLHEILALLAEARIPALLLKGAALVQSAYGSFAERPMTDLDVLVDAEHAHAAHRRLLERGWRESWSNRREDYQEHHHLPPLVDSVAVSTRVELHTELFMPGHPFGLTAALVRAHAQELTAGDRTVRVPSISHQMLHLCVHFSWSHLLRGGVWRTFRDINALVATERLDWESFAESALECRAATCCYWPLRLAVRLTHLDVPQQVLRALEPPLPAAVLDRLERHFLTCLLPSAWGCPSARLGQLLWEVAIRPGWSGHGKSRPWDRWEASRAFALPKPPDAESRGLRTRARKIAALQGYLRLVLP